MKILLVAINARFSHSNPAIYWLKANLPQRAEVAEFNINEQPDYILGEIYRKRPDILGISCYIWNRLQVLELANNFKKLVPNCTIILGGPEATTTPEILLSGNPGVDLILAGEGEVALATLISKLAAGANYTETPGLWYRQDGQICSTPLDPEVSKPNLSQLKFPYSQSELTELRKKIVYYESSRGCPFSCGYCLSAPESQLRFRSVDKVKAEVDSMVKAGVGLIKFVDRTFNCRPERALEIWQHLIFHTPDQSHFHFEIAADLLTEEALKLLAQAPPGKFQFEIGVQSTNPEVLKAIGRPNQIQRIGNWVQRLAQIGNIHLHLDLIAGLPLENWDSFSRSFDQVYQMSPHKIQLGFLKVLPGTPIAADAANWGLIHRDTPPYEILATNHLSYAELWKLKQIEAVLEIYGNSRRLKHTTSHLVSEIFAGSAFTFYESLAQFWIKEGLYHQKHKAAKYFDLFYKFLREKDLDQKIVLNKLKLDFALSEEHLSFPNWLPKKRSEQELRAFHHQLIGNREIMEKYFPNLLGCRGREIIKKTRLVEIEEEDNSKWLLIDYSQKDPVTGAPRMVEVFNTTAQ